MDSQRWNESLLTRLSVLPSMAVGSVGWRVGSSSGSINSMDTIPRKCLISDCVLNRTRHSSAVIVVRRPTFSGFLFCAALNSPSQNTRIELRAQLSTAFLQSPELSKPKSQHDSLGIVAHLGPVLRLAPGAISSSTFHLIVATATDSVRSAQLTCSTAHSSFGLPKLPSPVEEISGAMARQDHRRIRWLQCHPDAIPPGRHERP